MGKNLWISAAHLAGWAFLLSCSIVSTSHADRFFLSENRWIEGIMVKEDAKSVSFERDGAGVWTLSRQTLLRVEQETPGEYWLRVGDRHLDRGRADRARVAFEEATKDQVTRTEAENRIQDLEQPTPDAAPEETVPVIEDKLLEVTREVVNAQAQVEKPKEVVQEKAPRTKPTTDKSREWSQHVRKYASEYGIDPILVRAIIQVESRGNPRAVSKSGARGLMQLMPKTAAALGVKDAFDPEQNIRAGVKYLDSLMDQLSHIPWPERMAHVVASYNAGPNRIKKVGDYRLIPAASRYADKVMKAYEKIRDSINDEVAFIPHQSGS